MASFASRINIKEWRGNIVLRYFFASRAFNVRHMAIRAAYTICCVHTTAKHFIFWVLNLEHRCFSFLVCPIFFENGAHCIIMFVKHFNSKHLTFFPRTPRECKIDTINFNFSCFIAISPMFKSFLCAIPPFFTRIRCNRFSHYLNFFTSRFEIIFYVALSANKCPHLFSICFNTLCCIFLVTSINECINKSRAHYS